MRSQQLLLALSTASSAFALLPVTIPSTSNITVIPDRYIIEIASTSSLDALTAELQSLGGITILNSYDSDLFSGVSINATTGNIDTLSALQSAANVWSSSTIHVNLDTTATKSFGSATVPRSPVTSSSVPDPQGWSAYAAGSPYSDALHSMTGVDKLHAAGIYGKGAQIAIIDTGVDYTHYALGGCFGRGCKVAGGWDFIGNETCWPNAGCDKQPSPNPMDQIGQGTNMAGVIAGYWPGGDGISAFMGVAPDATIYAYKVTGHYSATDDDTLIDALLTAYEDGADIIGCSWTYANGWSDNAVAVVASRIAKAGVIVTVGAGELGSEGPFYGGQTDAGDQVIGVASLSPTYTATRILHATFNLDGFSNQSDIAFTWSINAPSNASGSGWPIVPLTLNTSVVGDACEPLPAVSNFTETFVLVRLGGCSALQKQKNLLNANMYALIFYLDEADGVEQDPFAPYMDHAGWSLLIEREAGVAIVETVLAGGNVNANFDAQQADQWIAMPALGDGYWTAFTSSWGPMADLSINPSIAAPGNGMLTTSMGDSWETVGPPDIYGVSLATYLAAHYVSGVAGLYIGKYGGRRSNPRFDSAGLTMRIISSGMPVPYYNYADDDEVATDYNAPVAAVGTGLINATKVLEYTTTLSYAKFALNDTLHFEHSQSVEITNNANVEVTYTFSLQDSAGFETWVPYNSSDPNTPRIASQNDLSSPTTIVPDVQFPFGTFTVARGATKQAKFIFNLPNTKFMNLPLYSGVIVITSSLGEELSIPYLGLGANLNEFFTTNFAPGSPTIVSGADYNVTLSDRSTWTFDLGMAQDFPRLYVSTLWGTEELRWDIYETRTDMNKNNWMNPPAKGKNGYIGSATYWIYSGAINIRGALTFPAWAFRNPEMNPFPITDVLRNSQDYPYSQYWWFGTLADGSQIAPGTYEMRVSNLIPFGDRNKQDSWDTWTAPFTVAPPPKPCVFDECYVL